MMPIHDWFAPSLTALCVCVCAYDKVCVGSDGIVCACVCVCFPPFWQVHIRRLESLDCTTRKWALPKTPSCSSCPRRSKPSLAISSQKNGHKDSILFTLPRAYFSFWDPKKIGPPAAGAAGPPLWSLRKHASKEAGLGSKWGSRARGRNGGSGNGGTRHVSQVVSMKHLRDVRDSTRLASGFYEVDSMKHLISISVLHRSRHKKQSRDTNP